MCLLCCSAGAGRTGTFCALSTVLERVKAEGILDVFQTVKSLRLQRPHMVQTLVCCPHICPCHHTTCSPSLSGPAQGGGSSEGPTQESEDCLNTDLPFPSQGAPDTQEARWEAGWQQWEHSPCCQRTGQVRRGCLGAPQGSSALLCG